MNVQEKRAARTVNSGRLHDSACPAGDHGGWAWDRKANFGMHGRKRSLKQTSAQRFSAREFQSAETAAAKAVAVCRRREVVPWHNRQEGHVWSGGRGWIRPIAGRHYQTHGWPKNMATNVASLGGNDRDKFPCRRIALSRLSAWRTTNWPYSSCATCGASHRVPDGGFPGRVSTIPGSEDAANPSAVARDAKTLDDCARGGFVACEAFRQVSASADGARRSHPTTSRWILGFGNWPCVQCDNRLGKTASSVRPACRRAHCWRGYFGRTAGNAGPDFPLQRVKRRNIIMYSVSGCCRSCVGVSVCERMFWFLFGGSSCFVLRLRA